MYVWPLHTSKQQLHESRAFQIKKREWLQPADNLKGVQGWTNINIVTPAAGALLTKPFAEALEVIKKNMFVKI